MTAECWVRFVEPFVEWAGCLSFAQDDGATEYGVFLSQRAATAQGAQLSFALSTAGGGDHSMTYLHGAESQVVANEWIHWAGTYDGTTMSLYINGKHTLPSALPIVLRPHLQTDRLRPRPGAMVMSDSTSQSGAINYPDAGYAATAGGWFTIGAYHDANEYYPLNGQLDDVRLWNVARSASEIQSAYCAGAKPHGTGLIGLWKFQEKSGDRISNTVKHGPAGVMMGDVFRVNNNVAQNCQGGH